MKRRERECERLRRFRKGEREEESVVESFLKLTAPSSPDPSLPPPHSPVFLLGMSERSQERVAMSAGGCANERTRWVVEVKEGRREAVAVGWGLQRRGLNVVLLLDALFG